MTIIHFFIRIADFLTIILILIILSLFYSYSFHYAHSLLLILALLEKLPLNPTLGQKFSIMLVGFVRNLKHSSFDDLYYLMNHLHHYFLRLRFKPIYSFIVILFPSSSYSSIKQTLNSCFYLSHYVLVTPLYLNYPKKQMYTQLYPFHLSNSFIFVIYLFLLKKSFVKL